MNETPKTNALLESILEKDGFLDESNAPEAFVALCRELERSIPTHGGAE